MGIYTYTLKANTILCLEKLSILLKPKLKSPKMEKNSSTGIDDQGGEM
jgi:hypothetical protein